MLFTLNWSVRKNYLKAQAVEAFLGVLAKNQYPLKSLEPRAKEEFKKTFLRDKKRRGRDIHYIFLRRDYSFSSFFKRVFRSFFKRFFRWLAFWSFSINFRRFVNEYLSVPKKNISDIEFYNEYEQLQNLKAVIQKVSIDEILKEMKVQCLIKE